ncbi:hypothetical protein DVH05_012877 [Phytophthora capsici]|nr:hypothetical protein DVH05_012877 [Phytophthora capsici]
MLVADAPEPVALLTLVLVVDPDVAGELDGAVVDSELVGTPDPELPGATNGVTTELVTAPLAIEGVGNSDGVVVTAPESVT